MPVTDSYLFIASMDVAPEKEALFNEVYDQEHVPSLTVPGVVSVTRFKAEPFTMSLSGQQRRFHTEGVPRYSAVYEIESPDVLVSREWAQAVEAGRWPSEVRPHTRKFARSFSSRHRVRQHRNTGDSAASYGDACATMMSNGLPLITIRSVSGLHMNCT